MSYGLRITNPDQDLVISSEARGLTCIGRATLYGAVVQASGDAEGPMPGRTWGYSTYRIAHAGPVVWAIDAPIGYRVGVISSQEVSAGLWEVVCHCGTTPDAFNFDTVQVPVAVWAFGFVDTLFDPSFRAAVYRSDGVLAYDLSQPHPLFPLAAGISVTTAFSIIPTLTRPVLLGSPMSDPAYDTSEGPNRWAAEFFRGVWERASVNELADYMVASQRWEYSATEPIIIAGGSITPTTYVVMEGALLP